jgi:DNA-binding MarR family transcriptional regulator
MTSSESGTHPALQLDDAVHQKTRLALLTVLDEAGRADFPYLKKILGLTDGNLGRHLDVLAQQNLVEITKGYEGRRPRTWAAITSTGRAALSTEMKVLAALLRRFEANESAAPIDGNR